MKPIHRNLLIVVLTIISFNTLAAAQQFVSLQPEVGIKFKIAANQERAFTFEAKADDVCNITTGGANSIYAQMSITGPGGETIEKDVDGDRGALFIAESTGTYRLIFKITAEDRDEAARIGEKEITVTYSNKLEIPKTAVSKGVRTVNGYQAKIIDETGEEGSSYLLIQKGGKTKALMRAEKTMVGGLRFADSITEYDGPAEKRSAELFRTTLDKTGDGTPDIAIEYYTGGAHCCSQITFFELGQRVRELPTIDTENDQLTAIAKRPEGGLRFKSSEQAFAYWTINFAQSPMPELIYEFNKSDELIPRFDLMKKPAPSLAVLKRKAAAAKAKINLNPYTSPEDNFNDFEEPFWDEMLNLIYTGHEELAWQYYDMVWPAKKPGKEKFLADFKEQLAQSSYGDWKRMHK